MGDRSLKIVGLAGSLRKASLNQALLRAVGAAASANHSFELFDLNSVPMFNQDVESAGDPQAVVELKAALHGADLVLMATPEYNGGISAALKNAVDWGSRGAPHAWDGRAIAVMGATPGRLGTNAAQRELRACLTQLNAYVMPQPRLLVAGAGSLFDDELSLIDEGTKRFVAKFAAAAEAWAVRF